MSSQNFETAQTKIQKFVEVPGGKLSYDVAGEGPVMLCLPGMGDTRRVYERFAPAMVEAGYRVITTDLRGNGLSTGKFASHSLNDLANDIKAILDAEGIQQAYLAAGSISGASAGLFATQYPERVLGLLLFAPIFYSGNRLMAALMTALIRIPGVAAPVWATYFKSLYPKQPVEADYVAQAKANIAQKGGAKSLGDMSWTRHLDEKTKQIKAPTLIFLGTKDPDYKDARAEAVKIQGDIPQARIEVFEGYGHYPQREAFEMVLPTTLEWLSHNK